MRPEDVNFWLTQEPFVPFRVSLSNGRVYDVRDPDCVVFVNRHTVAVGALDPDFPFPVLGKSNYVPLIHMNHIGPLPEPAATAG